jgi:hypothetical protein
MATVRVRLFGAFRECADTAVVVIEVAEPVTPKNVRIGLKSWISDLKKNTVLAASLDPVLVDDSALATDSEILVDETILSAEILRAPLAILPPVCGG